MPPTATGIALLRGRQIHRTAPLPTSAFGVCEKRDIRTRSCLAKTPIHPESSDALTVKTWAGLSGWHFWRDTTNLDRLLSQQVVYPIAAPYAGDAKSI